MKSLKEYSLNISDEAYHADPAWSHSKIARYAKEGFSALATLHDRIEPTASMRFGSLFDAIITHSGNIGDEYAVYDVEVPPARKAVLDRLAELSSEKDFFSVPEAAVKQALADCDYKAAKKYETQFDHLVEYAEYYALKKSGKKVVSKIDWDDAMKMADILLNDEYSKTLFGHGTKDGIEYIYQSQFKAKLWVDSENCVAVRIMPDLLKVDHNEKTIQPVDLKTSSCPAYAFAKQFLDFRYDIQASMYTDVLQVKINSIPEYKDYRILPYIFTDISRSDMVPVSYIYDPRDDSQKQGLCFGNEKVYQYKGWRMLLSEILAYQKYNAVVPEGISLTHPNDLLNLLANR